MAWTGQSRRNKYRPCGALKACAAAAHDRWPRVPATEIRGPQQPVRPPQIGNVRRDMLPALRRAEQLGVRRVALLSLQGADRNPFVPHRTLKAWLRDSS